MSAIFGTTDAGENIIAFPQSYCSLTENAALNLYIAKKFITVIPVDKMTTRHTTEPPNYNPSHFPMDQASFFSVSLVPADCLFPVISSFQNSKKHKRHIRFFLLNLVIQEKEPMCLQVIDQMSIR